MCGAEGWPRPPLCCSCSVMSGCYRRGKEWYRCAPDAGDRRVHPRLALPSRAQAAPPLSLLFGSGGSQFLHAKKKNPRTHSQAPPERRPPASQSAGT